MYPIDGFVLEIQLNLRLRANGPKVLDFLVRTSESYIIMIYVAIKYN